MNKAARNERRKLTATWFNGAAIAALAVGGFAPITGYATTTTTISPIVLLFLVGGWFLVSLTLHLVARRTLERIEE